MENMVSHVVATFYFDKLDKYIEEQLGIKAYSRYMDDFYCMHEDKEYRCVRDSYRGHLSYRNCNYLYNRYVIKLLKLKDKEITNKNL